MAKLLIEMGNTALKAVWTEGETLGRTVRYQGEKTIEFIKHITEKEKPEMLVVASVRDISVQDEGVLEECCHQLVIIDKNHQSILRAYGLPEYLGADRAAGIIAARKLFGGKECVIFDFGTILSIDFISSEGVYEGGNVSLGCRTRLKAINRYSKNLPLVNSPKGNVQRGNSLSSSIEAGVMEGIKFEINGYMASRPESVVVFTGGDADLFMRQTGNSVFVVNNLVLMGLQVIAKDYES